MRQEIFDSAEATNWVARLSNTLHVRTRPGVIERELLFKVGQPYDSVKVAETGRNLRSLGIFREVRIDSVRTDSGLVMRVTTRDGWTTRPGVRLRTVGGQVAFGVTFADDNFLGTATGLGVSYSSDPVRTNFTLSFNQPRLLGHALALSARWENRSDGTVLYGAVGRPFYSISSPLGFLVSGEYRDETVLQYLDGIDVPVDSLDHLMGAVRTSMSGGRSGGSRADTPGRACWPRWCATTTSRSPTPRRSRGRSTPRSAATPSGRTRGSSARRGSRASRARKTSISPRR